MSIQDTSAEFTMDNGAALISFQQGIVLCKWGNEYVTWQARPSRDDATVLMAEIGHYFTNLGEAVRDFENRVKRGY